MGPTRTLLAATAAFGLAVTAPVVTASTAAANNHVLRLTSRSTTSSLFIPCPTCVLSSHPTGAHIGGTQIDAGLLYDPTGHRVGHFALQSVGVTPFTTHGPGELALNALIVIGTDQIAASGLEEPPLNAGTAAITGGTGRYRSARGEIHYTDNPDGSTNLDITLND